MRVDGTNMQVIRGDTEAVNVNVRDNSGVSVPFVEGDIVYFTVKKSIHDETKIFQKVITQFIDGSAHIEISPADTKLSKPGVYYYDIQLSKADGSVKTIVPPSKFEILGEVTDE